MREHLIDISAAETDLLAAAAYLAENISSPDGHAESLKVVVARYLAKNEVDFAAQLADTIEDGYARDRLLADVAEKCAAIDDDEYALQLAEAIEDVGFQSLTRERIAGRKAALGEFDKAFEIAGGLMHPSDALAEIAVQQVARGDEAGALETISRIEHNSSRVGALQSVASHFHGSGNDQKAFELLDEAVAEAREIEFPEEKIRALIAVAGQYIEAKRLDKSIETLAQAQAVAETLEGAGRDSFLALISLDFLRSGSLELADRALDLVEDKTHIASCLAGFAMEFDARGDRAEALEALEEAYAILKSQRETEVRDSRTRFNVFGAIAARFAMLGRAERGIEAALENPVEQERHTALTQIARVCALHGDDELSRQALDAIDEDAARMFALLALSYTKNKTEKRDEALRILIEAESLSETVPQLPARSEALGELAARFHDFGETEKAREICTENLRTISHILDESHRAAALANLSATYENLGFELNETEKEILSTLVRRASI